MSQICSLDFSPQFSDNVVYFIYLSDREGKFKNPSRELFLWAVLQGRLDMANLFWRESKAPIGGALVASKILKEMATKEHALHESRRIVKYSEGSAYVIIQIHVVSHAVLIGR